MKWEFVDELVNFDSLASLLVVDRLRGNDSPAVISFCDKPRARSVMECDIE